MSSDTQIPRSTETILRSLSTFSALLDRTINEVKAIEIEQQNSLSVAVQEQKEQTEQAIAAGEEKLQRQLAAFRSELQRIQGELTTEIENAESRREKAAQEAGTSDVHDMIRKTVERTESEAYLRGLRRAVAMLASFTVPAD